MCASLSFSQNTKLPRPKIYFHDPDEGLIWIEDLGEERSVQSLAKKAGIVRGAFYRSALDQGAKLHDYPKAEWRNRMATAGRV